MGITKNIGIAAVSAAMIGISAVMLWSPSDDVKKAEPTPMKPKVTSEKTLGRLPKKSDKDKEKKEEKKEEEFSYEVVYNGYDNYDYYGYGYGGVGGDASYTTAEPNAHVEENTVANQAVVEQQIQEDAEEQAAEEAKKEVAEKELQVVYLDESKETTTVQEPVVVVTDDGKVTTSTDVGESGSSSTGDNREVIDLGVISFGDESTVSTSTQAAASVATPPQEVVDTQPQPVVTQQPVVAEPVVEELPVIETVVTSEPVPDYTGSTVVAEGFDGAVIDGVELLEGEGLLEVVIMNE